MSSPFMVLNLPRNWHFAKCFDIPVVYLRNALDIWNIDDLGLGLYFGRPSRVNYLYTTNVGMSP